MNARICIGAICILGAAPAAASEADSIRIARIRGYMAQNLERLPNYTCTQTIERSVRPAKGRRFQLLDTLRLEVALVSGKELFAWPGSGKFDDRDLAEIIGGGTSGNGNFGIFARSIFLTGVARFSYLGLVEREDRTVYTYSFRVPRAQSGYKLKVNEAEGIAGYRGRFEVDAESFDVVSLDVMTDDDIPSHVPIKSTYTKMRYQRMTIGAGEFLLPESSELSIVDSAGNQSRNAVQLSGCKQYGTESAISFADPPPDGPAPAPPPSAAAGPAMGDLPDGLLIEAEMDTPLHFPGSAVGDLVEGRVVSDTKRKGVVMIPKGAAVRGRLGPFGPIPARVPTLGVTIRLTEIDLPGGRAEIQGVVDRILPLGMAGARLSVDNKGIIFIVSGSRRELARGTRIWWRLEPKTEKR